MFLYVMAVVPFSLLAGVSAGIGALPIYLRKEFSKKALNFGMAFSAGVMLVAAFIALLVPSLYMAKDIYGSIWGFIPVLAGLVVG